MGANKTECEEAEKTFFLLVTVRGKWVTKANSQRILKTTTKSRLLFHNGTKFSAFFGDRIQSRVLWKMSKNFIKY